MAERAALDEGRIAAGERLLRRLEELGCAIPAALWSYAPDVNEWRLYVTMPAVQRFGPTAGAEIVSHAIATLRSEKDFPLTRQDILTVGHDHPVVGQVAAALSTGPALSRLRIQGTRLNGTLIEDALVYRVHKAGLKS